MNREYFAVDHGQVEPLISVDGWLSGLDSDGFADFTFEPAFLSRKHFHIVLIHDMTMVSTMIPNNCWLSVVTGVVFHYGCQCSVGLSHVQMSALWAYALVCYPTLL